MSTHVKDKYRLRLVQNKRRVCPCCGQVIKKVKFVA